MAKVYPFNYGHATLWHRLTGDPEEQSVTFDFYDPNAVPITPDQLAQVIYTAWVGTGKMFVPANVSNTLTAVRVDLVVWREEDVPQKIGTYSANTAGTRSSSPPPSNCAFFVRKYTGNAGRKYKGRFYWPAGYMVGADISAVGSITASPGLATLQTQLNNFFTALDTAGITPVIVHNDNNATPPTPITSFIGQQIIATQRRRLRP